MFSPKLAGRTTVLVTSASKPFITPSEFRRNVEAAYVVIAHAGMGSIITALELGKRIIVMPRRAELGEHRSDHQVATAKRFADRGALSCCSTERELLEKLDLA